MKKSLLLAITLFAGALLFADNYEVKTVVGKVSSVEEKDKKVPLTPGMTVSDATIVNIGINSKLVLLTAEGKSVTLRTPVKASVADMIESKNGLNGSLAKKGKGTATAASRASDVMAEGELDE